MKRLGVIELFPGAVIAALIAGAAATLCYLLSAKYGEN